MKRRLSFIALPILLSVVSCGGEALQRDARPAPPTKPAGPAPSPEVALPPDRPLTPARLMLVSDFALAPRNTDVFPLADGRFGFLDASGSRMIVTLEELRRVPGSEKLRNLCVADDGKAIIALSNMPGSYGQLLRADTFGGPMSAVGQAIAEGIPTRDRSDAYVVTDEKGATKFVECKSGRVETLGLPMSSAYFLHRDGRGIYVLRPSPLPDGRPACYLRTPAIPWTKLPGCSVVRRKDGTIAIDTVVPNKPVACAFVLDAQGRKLPCETPVGPPTTEPASGPHTNGNSMWSARFFAPSKIVLPMKDGALFELGVSGKLAEAKRIGSEPLVGCKALLPHAPLFQCSRADELDVIVSIDPQGNAREEWRRKKRVGPGTYGSEAPAVHVTADGGAAVGGDCEGNLGDVVCVRSASGAWQNVAFSKELVTALARTAPATMLIPSPVGPLYVATGTADNLLGGNVRVLVFRADKGPAVEIEKIPTWITASLAAAGGTQGGVAELLSYLGPIGRGSSSQPTLSWASDQRIRMWPMEREHPAFRTKEFCGLEVNVKGGFNADCIQGRVYAVGRRGLWEKRAGALMETLDAGATWKPVALPKGADTVDVECTPIGCRIGPYYRMGWGA